MTKILIQSVLLNVSYRKSWSYLKMVYFEEILQFGGVGRNLHHKKLETGWYGPVYSYTRYIFDPFKNATF